jgi:magnesium-protoporphyrin O-methyltransferase
VLDAGCGTGAMSAELARRGADVLGIDLAPEIIRFARETMPRDLGRGRIRFEAGDMLAVDHGNFDAVVAMDCLIHYSEADAVNALGTLAMRTSRSMVFTFAPRTLPLAAMHAMGRLFPRSDRAPAIVPVRADDMARRLSSARSLAEWRVGRTERVSSGFYKSQMMELSRP